MDTAKKPVKKRIRKPVKRAPKISTDPRQAAFLAAYRDPNSPTFANALQSALSVGYSQEYSENILHDRPKWLTEYIGREKLLKKAEAHLEEVMEMPILTQAMGAFGPIWADKEKTKPVMTYNTSRIKEKTRVAEIVLPAMDKKTYGKTDLGGGNTFVFNVNAARDRYRTKPVSVPVEIKPPQS